MQAFHFSLLSMKVRILFRVYSGEVGNWWGGGGPALRAAVTFPNDRPILPPAYVKRCPPHNFAILRSPHHGLMVTICSVSDPWFAFGALMMVVFGV